MRAALLAMALLGCNGGALDHSTDEHDTRFAGLWLVDQPTHAGYEATLYDFRDGGVLAHLRSFGFDFREDAPETGVVGRAPLTCSFGDRWRSKGREILVLDGDCSDGRARAIALGFFDDASRNSIDAPVEVLTVGGESGWQHVGFPWRFKKCTPDDRDCNFP